jgi:hypothetical protein
VAGGAKGAKAAKLNAQGVPFKRDGRECHGGDKRRGSSSYGLSASDF